MNNLQYEILKLIEENRFVDEVVKELNISRKNLFYQLKLLKDKGVNLDNKYYSDGRIKLKPKTMFSRLNRNIINIPKNKNSLHFIASSDNHLGSPKQNINNSYMMYDYCINNNIHINLNCGDFLSGKKSWWNNCSTIALLNQVERAVDDYPYDDSILNFIVFGNHDMAYLKQGISLQDILCNKRTDMIPLGHNKVSLSVKNDVISLVHEERFRNKLDNKRLVLSGHKHKYLVHSKENELHIEVPSISNVPVDSYNVTPGFLDIKINFNNDKFKDVYVKMLMCLEDRLLLVNEYSFEYNDEEKDIFLVK